MNHCICAHGCMQAITGVSNYRRRCLCKACLEHRANRQPRIRGPYAGRLWICKGNGETCSGMSPEQAYNNWRSFNQEAP